MRDPYLYPDSEVLRNLADIHDVDMLKNMEADYCSFRLSEIVVDDIAKDAKYVLSEMNAYDWQTASFENIVMSFSNYMAKLWKIHLYREGNTRTIVTFCCMFIEAQGIYIESDLFKDNASYMRSALVAANAIFHDLGDLRKPDYLYRIVQDALEKGKSMSRKVENYIRKAEVPVTKENIRKVVFWNRRAHKEHSFEEIRNYLKK